MKVQVKKEVTKIEYVTTHHVCDACGKESHSNSERSCWHRFNSNHQAWGNDSCDSFEYYEVCSVPCYILKLKEGINNADEYGGEVDEFNIPFAKLLLEKLLA